MDITLQQVHAVRIANLTISVGQISMVIESDDEVLAWFDATGCLRWGPQFLTGVPRVEFGVAKEVLKSDKIGCAYLDVRAWKYRPFSAADRSYLEDIVQHHEDNRTIAPLSFYRKHFVSVVRHATRETHRALAALISGRSDRKGLTYQIVKAAIRLSFFATQYFEFLFTKLRRDVSLQDGQFVLISHGVDRKKSTVRAIENQKLKTGYIVYDVIPVVRPDLCQHSLTDAFTSWLLRANDEKSHIFSISQGTNIDLYNWLKQMGRNPDNNGFDAIPLTGMGLSPVGEQQEIEGVDQPFVIFVSTFNPRKNHDLIIEVWAKLGAKIGNENLPQLVLIGREKPGRPVVHALDSARSRGVNILMTGSVSEDQLRWAYRHCLFTVFPSSYEGWGLGASESLAFGKIVAHTNNAQLTEAAQNLMPTAPERDVHAWVSLMEKLVMDEKYREKLEKKIKAKYSHGEESDFAEGVVKQLQELGADLADQN
ncbi:MAG: glycosyltransferase [Pseudomonadota bacterium]